jgi:hypothetical protein
MRTGHFKVIISDQPRGRFLTRREAETQEAEFCRMALRDGHAITTKIVWVPPMADTEQEADEFAFHEKLP